MDDLVSPAWLASELATGGIGSGLRVLDATYLPFEPERDAAAEYRAGHIPGAGFLDLATLADRADPRPAMAPPLDHFVARMAALGVMRDSRIVLYDDSPHHTSARAWWLLRLFGARHVALLDGGIAAWRAAGQPIEKGEETSTPVAVAATGFVARDDSAIRTLADMSAAVEAGNRCIVDARGAARFSGAEPDPRAGVAAGHMPGALNLPYGKLFEADGRWKPTPAIAAAFEAAGIRFDAPLIFTCGSGITAACLLFGAHLIGKNGTLYDGSWSEWGADPTAPKEISAE